LQEKIVLILLCLGILADKKGKTSEANKYYQESINLETDPKEKADAYYRLAEKSRKSGSYGKARGLYRKALAQNPSMGICYLLIKERFIG